MRKAKLSTALFIFVLLASVIIIPASFSKLGANVTIGASGKIGKVTASALDSEWKVPTSPLHTEGSLIKNLEEQIVQLKGVWTGMFADVSTGWWGLDWSKFDESALRETAASLRRDWGVNCVNTFFWGDWWLQNKNDALSGTGLTNIGLKDALKTTASCLAEYGIYFQIRLYSPSRAEGRIEGNPFQPTYSWTEQEFVNFWGNVANEMKGYNNVIFCLFDEPTGDQAAYFDAASRAIAAIRATGSTNLIAVQWGYCGPMDWVSDWINRGYPTENILFAEHIYRFHGTFAYDPNSSTDIEYIRDFLNSNLSNTAIFQSTHTKYIMDTHNVPVWVAAIGAAYGQTDDNEYIAFANTLQVLNEIGTGYCVFSASRTGTQQWGLNVNPTDEVWSAPNRVGQALVDAIAGIVPPPVYYLSVNSNPSDVSFQWDSSASHKTPYKTTAVYEGVHTITMPAEVRSYNHQKLFGATEIDAEGLGYMPYTYTNGPYTIDVSSSISSVYLYTAIAGKARVAIYDSRVYEKTPYPPNYAHPNNLIVESGEINCQADTFNLIPIPSTTLSAGTYFIAIKISENGMLSGIEKIWSGQIIQGGYSDAFDANIGTITGGTGVEFACYIPAVPLESESYIFQSWEDGSTNPLRSINLTVNMSLTATYQKKP